MFGNHFVVVGAGSASAVHRLAHRSQTQQIVVVRSVRERNELVGSGSGRRSRRRLMMMVMAVMGQVSRRRLLRRRFVRRRQFDPAGRSIGHAFRRRRTGRCGASAGCGVGVAVLSGPDHHVDGERRSCPILSRDPAGTGSQNATERGRPVVRIVQFDAQQSFGVVTGSGVGSHWSYASASSFGQQLLLVVFNVLFEVFLHRRLVDEFLFAFGIGTRVGTFAGVCSDVLIKYGFLPEAFCTLWTHVRLLARMDPDMLVEYGLLTERLCPSQNRIRSNIRPTARPSIDSGGPTLNQMDWQPFRSRCIRKVFRPNGSLNAAPNETADGSVCDSRDSRKAFHLCESVRAGQASLSV